LKIGLTRGGRGADDPGGDLHVLLADGLDHVAGGQVARGDLGGVQPDAHAVFARAEDEDIPHARHARDGVADVQQGVVGHVDAVVTPVRRGQVDDQAEIGAALAHRDALPAYLLRQPGLRQGHAVLHQHLRLVEVGPLLEGDGELHDTIVRGLAGHIQHVLDAIDLLLQRRGDGLRQHFGAGARIDGLDLHAGRGDLGILRDRQANEGNRADQHDEDGQDRCKDRTVDEEMGDPVHGGGSDASV